MKHDIPLEGVRDDCAAHCPELSNAIDGYIEVYGEMASQAAIHAVHAIRAKECNELGFSQETASGYLCRAPGRTGDETGQGLVIRIAKRMGVEPPQLTPPPVEAEAI